MPMRKIALTCFALLATLLLFVAAAQAQNAATPQDICANAPAPEPENRSFAQPEEVLEPGVDYRAVFCTDAGAVYIDLLEEYAPLAVNSFVFLSQQGYFNNTTFHRVLEDFMAQGGDPTATGTGGPGYQFQNEAVGFLTFDRPGWLAMANAGQDTNGSQFFITTVPYPSLDFGYTIFGEVLEGQENVGNISLRDPSTATEPGTALNTVVIVTDPASVSSSYEAPAAATQEEIGAMIDEINGVLPEILLLDDAYSGVFSTEDAIAAAPEAVQDDLAAVFEENGHEFRAAHRISNAGCDTQQIPYLGIGYTLDHFASREAATAVLDSGVLGQLAEAQGYTQTTIEGLDYPIYTRSTSACDADATNAITFWQRGSFVATAEATFPADSPATADRWLRDVTGIAYESIFSDALRRELR